jgi:hypothetical protein
MIDEYNAEHDAERERRWFAEGAVYGLLLREIDSAPPFKWTWTSLVQHVAETGACAAEAHAALAELVEKGYIRRCSLPAARRGLKRLPPKLFLPSHAIKLIVRNGGVNYSRSRSQTAAVTP